MSYYLMGSKVDRDHGTMVLVVRRANDYPGKSLKRMRKRVIDDEIGEEDWMPTDEVPASCSFILD